MNVVMYEKLLKNIVFSTVLNFKQGQSPVCYTLFICHQNCKYPFLGILSVLYQFSLLYLVAEKLNTLILCQDFVCIIVVCCCLTTGEIWNQRMACFGEKTLMGWTPLTISKSNIAKDQTVDPTAR